MFCETLIDESEVWIQQIDDAAILAHDCFEQHRGLALEGGAKAGIELIRFRHGRLQVAEIEPLPRKIVNERAGTGVCQHSSNLLFKDRGGGEPPFGGGVQKLIVRNSAPQKKGQARCQFQIA